KAHAGALSPEWRGRYLEGIACGNMPACYVHKNKFSFLNFILVVTAKRASISQSAMPTLGFQSNGRSVASEGVSPCYVRP
ncbi:MAG: hypothetical protein WAM72_16845, partial [Xanthobacteraceae bacterium]